MFMDLISIALFGMAGWAFVAVVIFMVTSSVKKYKFSNLKDATAELKRINDYLLKKVEEIEGQEDDKLEKVEKRDIIK